DSDWDELAKSLAAAKASRSAEGVAPTETPPATAPARGSFSSALALVLALISIGVAGMLWWQYRAFYVALDQNDGATAQALELADGRLAELGSPELAPVREAIARELGALRGVRQPDIEGILFSLGGLAARVSDLPMRGDARPAGPAAAVDEAEPGFGRLWLA